MMDQTRTPNITVSNVKLCSCLEAARTDLPCATVTDFPMYQVLWGQKEKRKITDLISDLKKLGFRQCILVICHKKLNTFFVFISILSAKDGWKDCFKASKHNSLFVLVVSGFLLPHIDVLSPLHSAEAHTKPCCLPSTPTIGSQWM